MAFLSIIVPVFNKEKYLSDCIQSILSQTFSDFELILVNDGSTDGSGSKCDYYKNIDSRIIVFHQKNQGVSVARNLGITEATGEYFGFIDADDTIESNMYKTLVNNALENNADISICRLRQNYAKQSLQEDSHNVEIFTRNKGLSKFLKGDLEFSACNKIFRKKIAKNCLFEGAMFEDAYFTFQAFLLSNKVVFTANELYNYFTSDNSVSISKFNLKYLDIVNITKKITVIASEKAPNHVELAMVLDFVMNLSLLNLILLSGRTNYLSEYRWVVEHLNGYLFLTKKKKTINKKHLVAYQLFKYSPLMYSMALKIYCLVFKSHVSHRI